MDCFLVDGLEVIFRIALAVLTIGKEELFAMDMEGMLKVGPVSWRECSRWDQPHGGNAQGGASRMEVMLKMGPV